MEDELLERGIYCNVVSLAVALVGVFCLLLFVFAVDSVGARDLAVCPDVGWHIVCPCIVANDGFVLRFWDHNCKVPIF
jgi:hypothetical protein